MLRFYCFVKFALEAQGRNTPEIQQIRRWIILSLKWPEVVRWINRSTMDVPQDKNDIVSGSSNYERLLILEKSGESSNLEDWIKSIKNNTYLNVDKTQWIVDDALRIFFNTEAGYPLHKRLSAGVGKGLW